MKRELADSAKQEISELQKQSDFSWDYTYSDYKDSFIFKDSLIFDISKEGTKINDLVSLLRPGEDLIFLINRQYNVNKDILNCNIGDIFTDYKESIYWNSDSIIHCFSNQGSIKESIIFQQNGDYGLFTIRYKVKYATELSKFCEVLDKLKILYSVQTNGISIQLVLTNEFAQKIEYYFEMDEQKKIYY